MNWKTFNGKKDFITKIKWIDLARIDGETASLNGTDQPDATICFCVACRTTKHTGAGVFYFKFVTDGEKWVQVLGDPKKAMTIDDTSREQLSPRDRDRVLARIKKFARDATDTT